MKHSARKNGGFTLVEILAAVAVLLLLGFIIAQVMDTSSKVTRQSTKLVDTASQARLVFASLEEDLSALVKRPDVPFDAQNVGDGNNLLTFISGVASPGGNRNISIIAYQVAAPNQDNEGPDGIARPCLMRAGKALSWATTAGAGTAYFGLDATGLPLSFPNAATPTPTTVAAALMPEAADFDILAPGVIRLIVGFQLYPNDKQVTLADNTTPTATGQIVYSPPIRKVNSYGGITSVNVIDESQISALVIGLVVIDLDSLRLLTSQQITELAGTFTSPAVGALPLASWGPLAATAASLPPSVPLPARQSLRVFQRFYPITPFASHL